jgi:hypothetical protein
MATEKDTILGEVPIVWESCLAIVFQLISDGTFLSFVFLDTYIPLLEDTVSLRMVVESEVDGR